MEGSYNIKQPPVMSITHLFLKLYALTHCQPAPRKRKEAPSDACTRGLLTSHISMGKLQ